MWKFIARFRIRTRMHREAPSSRATAEWLMHFFHDEHPHSVARGIRAVFHRRISVFSACIFFRLLLPRVHGNRNYCCINGARIPPYSRWIYFRPRVTSAPMLIANIFPPGRTEYFSPCRDKITLCIFFSPSPLSALRKNFAIATGEEGCSTYFSHGVAPASWSRLINSTGSRACPIYGLKWKMERDGYLSRAVRRDNLAEEGWISDKSLERRNHEYHRKSETSKLLHY